MNTHRTHTRWQRSCHAKLSSRIDCSFLPSMLSLISANVSVTRWTAFFRTPIQKCEIINVSRRWIRVSFTLYLEFDSTHRKRNRKIYPKRSCVAAKHWNIERWTWIDCSSGPKQSGFLYWFERQLGKSSKAPNLALVKLTKSLLLTLLR